MSQIVTTPPDLSAAGRALHVVLVEPEIPQNTGSIARLCAGTDVWLHLVRPLGYKLEDRYLKRAGLDYWPGVTLSVHDSLDAIEPLLPRAKTAVFTKHADTLHRDRVYGGGDVLVFGCETRGLPEPFVERWRDGAVRIPTTSKVRSLNLSNAVAIGVYEALGQQGWRGERPMPSA